ncbi:MULTISPECIES: non-ribosomal peptide synthetase [unclassified Bradyrhizobium]|uniref:non-ribosomal peptide synthetase n=1 Tax=unclassified Bradyrhizobium TaxID=2631580 RepID=UPI00247A3B45|nr:MULTISPECIES: non-ribosomal peptide synthetase [unclassified Bradyrhizobium]WGR72962.1 amino acid adenylation domain-containing protein [Bradyrhizobium sp. ISRA426]WGR77797.1 amino acid adenylation domain-containing protein [Bradyrhizobium sp. ISRA430]WGR88202.1 amino acid adenylation domain-containing protein [Bradyrhizobium sp. ISRA432]
MAGRVTTENESAKKQSMERQPVDAITAINRLAGSDPERVALRRGADELTYEALRSRSDALARTLREQGARGAVVGYWGGRNLDWATAVIAILKAGSTYLPLDPSLPASRTSFMIEQSRCALLMGRDRPESLSLFQESSKAAPQFVAIEAALRRVQTSSVVPSPNVDGLAYILFTSGSTGQPKGAMIERAGLNNHLAAKIDALSLTRTDCVAQTASHCFDISLWQLLSGLCVGASTSIIDDATLRSPSSLLQAIQRCGATVVQFVPSMLAVFVEYLQSLAAAERAMDGLRIISTVGEPLTPGLARAWLALYPRVSILNHYGPTECADGVTHHLVSVPPALAEPYVSIGRPIQNVEVYVADGPRLCNVGEVGEICVSGVGVAAGYVNDHVRTKDAFGPNPFSNDLSFQRLYRTGDLGRLRSDGLLECLGRRDRQVKIRGHRIELGEIEARLSAHPLVHGAVAVASACAGVKLTARDIAGSEAQAESRRLVAYVSAPAELAESDLQNFLAEALPSYMLPERIIRVSSIPLTRNGKVDFAALPDPGSVRPLLSTPFEEPQSDLEVRLRQIWSSILRIENIGVNDQFISLGGDSLRAMLILGQLQTLLGVRADFRLVLNGTIRSLAASIEARTEFNPCTALTCRKLNRSPLTHLQEHLWFLAQLDPSARNYIIQGGLRIKGNIDLARFNRAWTEVIHAHQAFSARFIDEDGPVQCFDASPCTNLELIDASHLTSSEAEELIAQFRRTELKENFDLAQGHLFRARMVQCGPDNHLILITAHEIILDAWSISVLLRDLQQRYLDPVAPWPENRASLSGYAAWEKQHVSPEALENQRHYWRRQIGDDPPVLSLGTGRARPQTNSYRGASHPVLLGSELSSRVREFARRNGCTTSTTLLACFQLLLRMYSGQDDIVVGMPHAVRDQPGSADIIGFFLNMLPIRAAIDAGQSFAAHATRIQGLVSDAIANSAYPFGWVVRDTRLCREPGRSPIFQVMFNMYSEAAEPLGQDELALTFREYDTGYVKFDLTLYAQDQGDEIALQLAYAEDIFSTDLAVRMANNLRCLIAACVDKPLVPIEELSCLSASDLTILDSLDGSTQRYESECPLVEAFEQISVSNHGKVAYFGEFGEVTFGQLRERVVAIRSLLRDMQVGAGDLVAMLVDRSPDVAAVMLAARGLDAVVVPIAPEYPRDRIQHILRDSEPKLLVHANITKPGFEIPSICLLTLETCSVSRDDFAPSDTPSDHRIANLIYTSSSTGRAKGVLIPEAAILNRLNWMWRCFPFDGTDVMVIQKSACLVASAWEYFGGLLRGVPTLILTQGQVLDPDLLLCSLAKHRVTRFFASPPVLSGLIGSQERQPQRTALRLVTSSAEPMPSSLPARWREAFPGVPLWNFYGATECASNAAVHETSDADDNSALIPVGRPIDNVKLYVLDSRLRRVPVGAAGELCIAGRCLSAGYWRDQDRTDRCFVPNPYDGGQYNVLYRSGDIARISTSGLLEICGRSDNQIKVRGFRIEPEEVEVALESHPAIAKAAVFAEGIDDDRRLTASVVPARKNLSAGEILAHLRNRLPSAMVPAAFRLVDSIPLTTSGKIDRARLSSVPYREVGTSPSAEPRTRNERVLAQIWEDLLGAKGVGIDSSFFDIGGDSLLSVRCVTLACKAGLNLTVNQLYRTPTIRELAAGEAEAAPHNVASADGLLPVPPIISFWNSLLGFDEHFNIGDLFFLRGGILNIKILDRALAHVIERHEGLRLRVARTQDGLRLGIGPCPTERIVEEIDLVRMTGPDQRRTIETVSAKRQHMFRFDGHTPLVHVAAFRTSESGDYYLLVLMHHFVADGMGYRLFLEALEGAYNALAAGHDVNGPETVQRLSPWLKRLEHYANSEAPDELKYWEGIDYDQFNFRVSDASSGGTSVAEGSARELHDARLGGRREDANGRSLRVDQAKYHLEIDGEATAGLLSIGAGSAHCQDFDVFLAALSGACGALFGNYSLWIDSLTSTRGRLFDDFDSSQIIGLISELVPLPLNVTGRESRSDRARSINRQRNALPRGGIGFRALKFLNRDPAVRSRLDRLPLPRIGVNYRAGLQRHFPRRFLDTDPYPLWIGENMHQVAAIHVFWFDVGYQSGHLQIDITYDPSMVDYEVTRHLCAVLQQELLQTINEFVALRAV